MKKENISLLDIRNKIRNIPDFPIKGIQFKDITTILADPAYFQSVTNYLYQDLQDKGITKIIGIESRGFIFGGALSVALGAGFVPVRKPGKLPFDTYKIKYELEYGSNELEMHKDALSKDDVVLIHDDLLATGGTAVASLELAKKFGVKKVLFSFVCELGFLQGRGRLAPNEVYSLIHF